MLDRLTLGWQHLRPYGRFLYYVLFPGRRPDYFRTPWTFPVGSPQPAHTVIFLPMTDWHARIQRSQQLAKAIAAAGGQVVYVNPHLGLEYSLPYALDPRTHTRMLGPRLFELHIHLPREHELHRRALVAAESARIAGEIARVVDSAGIREATLVLSFPAWLDAAAEVRRRYGFPLVYDCHDWLRGFGRTSPAVLEAEGALFDAANAVVFSSQFLQDLVLAHHPIRAKSVLIRNGTDPLPASSPRVGTDAPAIGYVGALDHWFDIDCVAAVAAANPGWRVVLAGRVEDRRILQLRRHDNVTFMGEVPRAAVPDLLHTWDAAMIPFIISDLTLAANPIKLYEYFSAGLPVVSTRLPEVEIFGNLVYLAGSPAQFAAQALAAVEEKDPSRRETRIATAHRETWETRAAQLVDCMRSLPGRVAL